ARPAGRRPAHDPRQAQAAVRGALPGRPDRGHVRRDPDDRAAEQQDPLPDRPAPAGRRRPPPVRLRQHPAELRLRQVDEAAPPDLGDRRGHLRDRDLPRADPDRPRPQRGDRPRRGQRGGAV
ncbi:MAG: hypothetical protein AVDCRST_MAG49-983, partial [uncultured Thermomicrobiales bacterium]